MLASQYVINIKITEAVYILCLKFSVYFVFIAMTIFGTVNTLWISLDSINNKLECNFIEDFFMATVFDCFIYQVVILVLKALIYAIIIRGKKNSCIRAVLLCVISSLPWIFNLSG